jgi:hypothetical protein
MATCTIMLHRITHTQITHQPIQQSIQEIWKFLISNTESRCYILMNAGKTDAQTQENT